MCYKFRPIPVSSECSNYHQTITIFQQPRFDNVMDMFGGDTVSSSYVWRVISDPKTASILQSYEHVLGEPQVNKCSRKCAPSLLWFDTIS